MPEHIVLKQNGTGWVEIGRVEAVRPAVAIEALVTEPGEYIAVTAARFRPMKVEPVRALKVVNEKEPA